MHTLFRVDGSSDPGAGFYRDGNMASIDPEGPQSGWKVTAESTHFLSMCVFGCEDHRQSLRKYGCHQAPSDLLSFFLICWQQKQIGKKWEAGVCIVQEFSCKWAFRSRKLSSSWRWWLRKMSIKVLRKKNSRDNTWTSKRMEQPCLLALAVGQVFPCISMSFTRLGVCFSVIAVFAPKFCIPPMNLACKWSCPPPQPPPAHPPLPLLPPVFSFSYKLRQSSCVGLSYGDWRAGTKSSTPLRQRSAVCCWCA